MMNPPTPVNETVFANGAPTDSPARFGGAIDPGLAPTVVYPPDGVLLPPNLNELEIMFRPSGGTSLYELTFTSTYLTLTVYTTCVAVGNGCGYLPDEPTMTLLATQARGDTVRLSIRATGSAGTVGQAAPRTMSFADEDLKGGLYYWAAGSGAINRYDFGRRGQTAESFYTPGNAGAQCVGCHALSRNGSRIAVGLNVPGPATLRILDVTSRAKLYESGGMPPLSSGGSNYQVLSPDGAQIITSEGADLVLRDAGTGAKIGTGPLVANGTMPDWSADGTKVVFARSSMTQPCVLGICPSGLAVDAAGLFIASFSGGTLGAATQLVAGASGNNNYYPAFSPDGTLVAFNRSATGSMDAPDARVMVVDAAGGTPVDLTAANQPVGNSWPKFAPFVSHFKGQTVFWLTFSSRRDYGLRILNEGKAKEQQVSQLWMVAVSPARLNDGGYPAFWLPFQDPATGNHIAQWTEKVDRAPCSTIDGTGCAPGEMCENGECVGTPIY
jgi:hypothetical protein